MIKTYTLTHIAFYFLNKSFMLPLKFVFEKLKDSHLYAKRHCSQSFKYSISPAKFYRIQGVSCWSVQSKSALRGTRIHNFIELWCLVGSVGLEIWVLSTSFQKSNMGWPQQPPAERALKFNIIFHDSTQFFFSKHQSKAEFKNLDDTEVLSSDFPDLRSSATSMTSTASTTPVASMTSATSFHQFF